MFLDRLFGKKLDDDEFLQCLQVNITEFLRFCEVLQDDAYALSRSPERVRHLARELDANVRNKLEGYRPSNKKYVRFHGAFRKLVRLRSMQTHDTACFVENPDGNGHVPQRTVQIAAIAEEQIQVMCSELARLKSDELRGFLGDELLGRLVGRPLENAASVQR